MNGNNKQVKRDNSKICFFGTFPPRECGIATFTKDLSTAMNRRFNPSLKSRVIAINENDTTIHNYPGKVVMQISGDDITDYIGIARRINKVRNVKLVCIQHEFGLFGGNYGDYLVPFFETVEKPVVIVFHSVLPNPDKDRKRIVEYLISNSSAVIVMAEKAKEIFAEHYDVDLDKVNVVPHGVDNVPFQYPDNYKKKLGLEGKKVILTFGLMSVGKGMQYMIKAMPQLIKKYPNMVYLIVGETHPVVRNREGEKYRNTLIKLVKELGLEEHVKFYNSYLTVQEKMEYHLASDVYVCTNLDKNQIVSGTLAYAAGCGKAVVSTSSVYADELLDQGRGILIGFRKPTAFAEAVDSILSDKEFRDNLERSVYAYSRAMTWQNVAAAYLKIFNRVVELKREITEKYPLIKLNHLKRITDDFGVIQFSEHSKPDKNSGYTADDNARALVVAAQHYNLFKTKSSLDLMKLYLGFLEFSQESSGRFVNYIQKKWDIKNKNYSEDSFGRVLWSLGYVIDIMNEPFIIEKAKKMFDKSYKKIRGLGESRSKAYSIIGLYHYNKRFPSEENLSLIGELADSLARLYDKESSADWQWFESHITYSNSKLPESLFLAYLATGNRRYLEVAEKTLEFLTNLLIVDGELSLIGQGGWYNKNGRRAYFDQQPVDAASMVSTYLVAYSATQNRDYYDKAVISFNWFLGKNYLKQMMYNESTGGCYDGLGKAAVNLNQGAESTISYLIARLLLGELKKNRK